MNSSANVRCAASTATCARCGPFLLFLQEQGQPVPHALTRIRYLKEPQSMPKFLTDGQIRLLQEDFERRVLRGQGQQGYSECPPGPGQLLYPLAECTAFGGAGRTADGGSGPGQPPVVRAERQGTKGPHSFLQRQHGSFPAGLPGRSRRRSHGPCVPFPQPAECAKTSFAGGSRLPGSGWGCMCIPIACGTPAPRNWSTRAAGSPASRGSWGIPG